LIDIDVILVTYNSEKWIPGCLFSLEKTNYPKEKITLTFVDNNSTDKTRELLESYKYKQKFGAFNTFFMDKNLGFGKGNNYGVKKTNQAYIYFLNVDTEIDEDCFLALSDAVEKGPNEAALWESRQFPYEHPKVYNPVTLETSWSSGACMLVDRERFIEVGMFDDKIFMYGEDVDLSWRLRAHGYKLQYISKSIVTHYTYMSANEVKPNQFYNSTYMNFMLRYKFGTWKDIFKGYAMYHGLFFVNGPSVGHKKIIFKKIVGSFFEGMKYRRWYRKNKDKNFKPGFKLWDYEIVRDGAFYVNQLPVEQPLVSVLIRTCGRPNVLREALISVRNQTYKNIEVIVVEDGPDISRSMIVTEFADLNIVYQATGESVGRCEVGNIALATATGSYFNFLDDDDLFYSDHVEVLVDQLLQHPDHKAAYSISFEVPTEVISREPYVYEELFHNVQHKQPFNRLVLMHHNYFPIQTVMFKRELFEELGGIDLSLEVLEDWDLWLRYALRYNFKYVEKLTSLYRIPAHPVHHGNRQELFDRYLQIVRNKHMNQRLEITMADIFKDAEYLMNKPATIIHTIRRMSARTFAFKLRNKLFYWAKRVLK